MPDGSGTARVAFNAALLSTTCDFRGAGIHRYIAGLLGALAERDDVTLTVLAADPDAGSVLPPSVRVRTAPRVATRPVGRIFWEQVALPAALPGLGADVLHSPAYAMPLAAPVPVVVTVHDLSFFRMPEALPRARGLYLRAATRLAVRHAEALIAVSEFTRRELINLLGAVPSRIHVVPNGLDPEYEPASAESTAAYRSRAGLPERFVLAVGTLEPRKNLVTLVEAYAKLRQVTADPPTLVIAGAPGWGPNAVVRCVEDRGLTPHVRFIGYVPAEDLPLLYSAAALFAYPSRYEGFGLPVIEAMACGTPVIASSAASLPEVAGEAALTVDPQDVAGWAEAMRAVLADTARAASMAGAGRVQATRFSWTRAARETATVYRRVLRTRAVRPRPVEARHHGS